MKCASFFVLLLVILFSGCSPAPPVGGSLEDSSWKLVSITSENGPVQIPDSAHLLMEFDTEKVTGNSGCNNFFGSYSTSEGNITISGLGATRMFCPEAMRLEEQFLRALEAAESYSVRREELLIKAGIYSLLFHRLSRAEEAAMEREQKVAQLDRLFASDLDQGPLHLYAVEYPNEVESYPFEGTEIPYELYDLFGPELATNWQDLGWGVYAIGKYHDRYLIRIPGRYTSDQIALYELQAGQMQYLASLASKWCETGWCNQQDGWLLDLNDDNRFDIVTHYAQLDESQTVVQEELEVKLQTADSTFVKTNDLEVGMEDYPLYQ